VPFCLSAMHILIWIILFSLLGGVLSVLLASSFLLFSESVRVRLVPHLISFAIGALLGAALLGLLPEAVESAGAGNVYNIFSVVLLGILGFFLLEKMVLWRHCHTEHCEAHTVDRNHNASGFLILVGDGIHNFVDGVLIAGAFMTDIHLGVVTSLAVAAHEIPQELGDFAILLHSGFSRKKALFFNLLSSLTTVIGGVLAYFSLMDLQNLLPYVLSIAAASFLYVAVADLIPGLHKHVEVSATALQVTLISAGLLVIYLSQAALH